MCLRAMELFGVYDANGSGAWVQQTGRRAMAGLPDTNHRMLKGTN